MFISWNKVHHRVHLEGYIISGFDRGILVAAIIMGKTRPPHDINWIFEYLSTKKYPPNSTADQKRSLRRSAHKNFKVSNLSKYRIFLMQYNILVVYFNLLQIDNGGLKYCVQRKRGGAAAGEQWRSVVMREEERQEILTTMHASLLGIA